MGVAGGGSDASVYIVNWRCNFLVRVVNACSSEVSVAFVVDNFPTAWRLAVVAVARFGRAWAWVCSVCSWNAMFSFPLAAYMWA